MTLVTGDPANKRAAIVDEQELLQASRSTHSRGATDMDLNWTTTARIAVPGLVSGSHQGCVS